MISSIVIIQGKANCTKSIRPVAFVNDPHIRHIQKLALAGNDHLTFKENHQVTTRVIDIL
jgi:hypothetical protein